MKGQFRRQNETRLTFTAPVQLNPNQTRRCSVLQRRVDGVTASLEIIHPFSSNGSSVARRCVWNARGPLQEKSERCSSFGSGGECGNISQVYFVWWQLSAAASLEIAARGLVPLVHADNPVAAFSPGSCCCAAAGLMLFFSNESLTVVKHLLATVLAVSFLQKAESV